MLSSNEFGRGICTNISKPRDVGAQSCFYNRCRMGCGICGRMYQTKNAAKSCFYAHWVINDSTERDRPLYTNSTTKRADQYKDIQRSSCDSDKEEDEEPMNSFHESTKLSDPPEPCGLLSNSRNVRHDEQSSVACVNRPSGPTISDESNGSDNNLTSSPTGERDQSPREKLFICSLCSYRCSRSNHLYAHMRRHTGDKPFACTVCSFRCSQSSNLYQHMRTHTGEKPFSCSLCSFKCSMNCQLTRHMRSHVGEKPYACTLCPFRCKQNSNLSQHMLCHTGEKPYACTLCSYTCKVNSRLSRHMLSHTGEKPYSCTLCSFGFSRSDDLTKHMRIHTGEKPFACTVCSYRCNAKGNLSRHVLHHHPDADVAVAKTTDRAEFEDGNYETDVASLV